MHPTLTKLSETRYESANRAIQVKICPMRVIKKGKKVHVIEQEIQVSQNGSPYQVITQSELFALCESLPKVRGYVQPCYEFNIGKYEVHQSNIKPFKVPVLKR